MEFFFQLFLKEGFDFAAFILRPALRKPLGHSFAYAVHEKPHLGSIVHIQDIIEPQLRTTDDTVESGKGGVVVKHEAPPWDDAKYNSIVLSFLYGHNF